MKCVLVMLAIFAGCNSSKPTEAQPAAEAVEVRDPTTVTMTQAEITAAGVKTEAVTTTAVVVNDDLPGTIEAQSDALVIVNARAGGIVESLALDVGDHVKVGQKLATIRSLVLADAQAAYRRAAEGSKYAATALERSENLKREGVISQRRLEADQLEAREKKLALEEATGRIRILGGGTNDVSGVTAITSPIEGVIAARKANRGESVAENSPLFTVVDVSRIVVQLRAMGGTQVVPGTPVTFNVEALPARSFTAVVKSSADLIDPETRRFFIRCSVENPDGVLKPGMFVTGHVPRPGIQALTVAEVAIQTMDGKPTVFVAMPAGKFERRTVVLGARADGKVAIDKGVAAGELVVTEGAFFVRTQLQKSELEE